MKNNIIDFFLVGAARCGTTSLYNLLKNCEGIFLPSVKEPNFFSDVHSPKAEDYKTPVKGEKHHAKIINDIDVYNDLYIDASENQLKGDTSPSYIWDTNVAQKLFLHNPKAKIIISLRHPVDRAYSHYIMNYYTGVDNKKSFELALEAPKNPVWGSCNEYLKMGLYYNQVKAYYDVFPEDQIKVLIYEDWTNNLESEIMSLINFLGTEVSDSVFNDTVESNKIKPVKKKAILNFLRQNKIKGVIKNVVSQERIDTLKAYFFNDNSKEIEKLNPVLKQRLNLKFEDDIQKLSKLTGINFKEKWI
ncbi:sulfotransferase domain-containing protein [Winogradskyella sp. A2]|uniref:sulfotransferase domain-containing protein n=1 Tax=Winogradskyella sp. A2 TaxID=3366944 RepID=UPI00398C25AC